VWRSTVDLKLFPGSLFAKLNATPYEKREIIHNGPRNGQLVQNVGETIQGNGINGVPTAYFRGYSPDFGVTGYVNAYFIG
jgi:hypothetical protein